MQKELENWRSENRYHDTAIKAEERLEKINQIKTCVTHFLVVGRFLNLSVGLVKHHIVDNTMIILKIAAIRENHII